MLGRAQKAQRDDADKILCIMENYTRKIEEWRSLLESPPDKDLVMLILLAKAASFRVWEEFYTQSLINKDSRALKVLEILKDSVAAAMGPKIDPDISIEEKLRLFREKGIVVDVMMIAKKLHALKEKEILGVTLDSHAMGFGYNSVIHNLTYLMAFMLINDEKIRIEEPGVLNQIVMALALSLEGLERTNFILFSANRYFTRFIDRFWETRPVDLPAIEELVSLIKPGLEKYSKDFGIPLEEILGFSDFAMTASLRKKILHGYSLDAHQLTEIFGKVDGESEKIIKALKSGDPQQVTDLLKDEKARGLLSNYFGYNNSKAGKFLNDHQEAREVLIEAVLTIGIIRGLA